MKDSKKNLDIRKSKDQLLWELKKLRQQTEKQLKLKDQELKQLNKVLETVNSTLDIDEVMPRVLDALSDIFSINQISIYLFNSEKSALEVTYWYGDQVSETLRECFENFQLSIEWDEVYFIKSFLDNETVYVSPVTEKLLSYYSPRDRQMFEWNPHKSILIVPLNVQGKVIGIINFVNTQEPFTLTDDDISNIERYVAQVASSINNAYLVKKTQHAFQRAKDKEREIQHLNMVIQATNASLDFDQVFSSILTGLQDVFEFEALGIQLVDEENKLLNIYKVYGDIIEEKDIKQWRAIQISSEHSPSVSSYVFANNEMAFFPHITPDMPFDEIDKQIYAVKSFSGYLAFPLVALSKKIGVISFFRTHQPFDLNEEKINQIDRYVSTLSSAIKNSKTYQELQISYNRIDALLAASIKLYRLKSTQEIADFTAKQLIWAFPEISMGMIFKSAFHEQHITIFHNMSNAEQAFFIEEFPRLNAQANTETDHQFVTDFNLMDKESAQPLPRKKRWKIFAMQSTEKLVCGKLVLRGINLKNQNESTLQLFVHQISSALENRVLVERLNST